MGWVRSYPHPRPRPVRNPSLSAQNVNVLCRLGMIEVRTPTSAPCVFAIGKARSTGSAVQRILSSIYAPRVVGVEAQTAVKVELRLCPRTEDQRELGLRSVIEPVSAIGGVGAVGEISVIVLVVEIDEIIAKARNGAKPWLPLNLVFKVGGHVRFHYIVVANGVKQSSGLRCEAGCRESHRFECRVRRCFPSPCRTSRQTMSGLLSPPAPTGYPFVRTGPHSPDHPGRR